MKTKLLFAALVGTTVNAYASCGSSFCATNTNWDTQGLITNPGLRVGVRYSYSQADTPRSGKSKVSNDLATGQADTEVENLRTLNQSLNLDIDFALNSQLSIALAAPWVIRDHSHTLSDGAGGGTVEQGQFSQLGDIRLMGSYQFATNNRKSGSGIRLGLKLPTGQSNWEFIPGNGAAEGGLQPGSGSTDLILGGFYYQQVEGSSYSWFLSGQLQSATITRDDYRPGNETAVDFGMHYSFSPSLAALLQLNANLKDRDTGNGGKVNAHSGSHSLSISPGLSFAATTKTRLYGFVQLPIYQYVNPDPAWVDGQPITGQLTAPWTVSVGISQTF